MHPSAPIQITAPAPRNGKTRWESFRTFCLNTPVIIAKQHLFCCVIFPLLSGLIGGSVGAALHTERAEITAGIIATPIVTFGVMAAEQWWCNRKSHTHVCNDPNHNHDHKILTIRKYLLQAAIGYAVFFTAHALLP